MGDVVITSPVVRCIKEQLGAEIHFVTNKKYSDLFKYNPYVDHVIEAGTDLNTVKKDLIMENYDLVVDLHKSIKSTRLSIGLGCPVIKYDKLNVKKWLAVYTPWDMLPESTHLVDRYFEALAPIGIVNDGKGLDFYLRPNIKTPTSLPSSYEVLVLGATYYTKRIPTPIANKIIANTSRPVILIGGEDVSDQANELSDITGVVNQVGKLSIQESAYVLSKATMIHTGDTGMMHIAAALRCNITVYWGNTYPKFGMYPYQGTTDTNTITNKEVNIGCRPCSKLGHNKCPKGHFACMLKQEV